MDNQQKTQQYQKNNPRGNKITSEEIEQTLKDIKQWFQQNAKQVYQQIENTKKATDQELEQLSEKTNQKIPDDFNLFLRFSNGNFQLHDSFKSLSVQQIIDINEINAVSAFWKKNYLTIAQDIDQNYLLIECNQDGSSGNIVSWNNDEGVMEELNQNFGLYLEKIRNGLLKSEYEYIDQLGLVEKAN